MFSLITEIIFGLSSICSLGMVQMRGRNMFLCRIARFPPYHHQILPLMYGSVTLFYMLLQETVGILSKDRLRSLQIFFSIKTTNHPTLPPFFQPLGHSQSALGPVTCLDTPPYHVPSTDCCLCLFLYHLSRARSSFQMTTIHLQGRCHLPLVPESRSRHKTWI